MKSLEIVKKTLLIMVVTLVTSLAGCTEDTTTDPVDDVSNNPGLEEGAGSDLENTEADEPSR